MNNFYALIYLTAVLKNKCKGRTFLFSTSQHKNVWDAYLSDTDQEKRFRITFSASPSETALFTDSHRPAKKANTIRFFEPLSGEPIRDITIARHDRYITFFFDHDFSLMFQIFGNTPNIFLLKNDQIIDSFKAPDQFSGHPAPEPRTASTTKTPDPGDSAKRVITKLDPKFPRHLIPLIIEEFKLENKSPQEIGDVIKMLIDSMQTSPEFRVLENGNVCLIPERILPYKNLKKFANVDDAIRFAYYKASQERRLEKQRQSVQPKIEKTIQKCESAIKQLKKADKGIRRAEKYEKYGHILMAHAHEQADYRDSVIFPDLYNENENEKVTIPVKPQLSLAENAQYYYEKSAKSMRGVKESKKRLKDVNAKLQKLKKLQISLQSIERLYEFRDWYKEHEDELIGTGVLKAEAAKKAPPYRIFEIDGYEIWVGKNAKSNDLVTTNAHKEDVWMHARGVSGSHVVIRMNNQKNMPPKEIILKAASVAAWNSKAKGSELAPVIVTKRKYIVKPKGAPAGTVRVTREDVEMVQPQKLPA